MLTTWDFVENYYPNYDSSDEIAENEDLTKIINGQLDGYAEEMYEEAKQLHYGLSNGMLTEQEVHQRVIDEFQIQLDKSNASIYKQAIDEYIKIKKI